MTVNADRALGELTGTLAALVKNVDENHRSAQAGRALLFDKIDSVDSRLQAVEISVRNMEPKVQDFSKWKARAEGAVMLVSAGAAVIGAGVALLWSKITGEGP